MQKQIVHLFVFNTLSDWEPGYAVAGINNPAFQAKPGSYQVQTVGLTKETVTTLGGVTILPDITLDELDPPQSAMLILPGGVSWDEGKNSEAVAKAIAFLAANVPVAAICGATAGLARAGILDERRHTSNSLDYVKATGYQGEALYEHQPAVTDGNVITASGTAPLEFAYHIFKKLGIYTGDTLEAWYGLFKTGDLSYFTNLVRASGA
ncbi:MAG: type 1 glutamine amidotransferase family protein [Syntrophaceae bacterium]